jgi:hypothetical protein
MDNACQRRAGEIGCPLLAQSGHSYGHPTDQRDFPVDILPVGLPQRAVLAIVFATDSAQQRDWRRSISPD